MSRKVSWDQRKSMYTREREGGILHWCHSCGKNKEHCEGSKPSYGARGPNVGGWEYTGPSSHEPHDMSVTLYTCSTCGEEFCWSCLTNHGCWDYSS